MAENLLALENQLCFAVYSASHAFTKAYKPLLARLDLTYPQYLVMLFLWEKHEASVGEIAAAMGLDTGTLSPLLKRLEKTGYISRQRSKSDERQVQVHITPLGLSKRSIAEGILQDLGTAIGCSFEEIVTIREALKTIRSNLAA